MGAHIIGISPYDSGEVLQKFKEAEGFPFQLLPDPGGAIHDAYGLRRRFLGGFKRATILIGPGGSITHRFHSEIRFRAHARFALRHLSELTSKKNH